MYAGEDKLKLGLERLHKADDNADLLGAALTSFHGALEDRFRHALAATPEFPASDQKRVLDVTKVQWAELIDMMRLYRGLSADDAAQIQKMNRERQSVAHGDRYKAGRAALERYAQLVQSFFPGLELKQPGDPAPAPAPKRPPAARPQPVSAAPPARPQPRPAAARQAPKEPSKRADSGPEQKEAAPRQRKKQPAPAAARAMAERPRPPVNPALFLIAGLLFIVACVGLSTLMQNTTAPSSTSPEVTQVIPTLPSIPALPDLAVPVYRITSDVLNMRTEPGLTASIITTLPAGARVELLNEERNQDQRRWIRVRAGGQEGWVDGQYLQEEPR